MARPPSPKPEASDGAATPWLVIFAGLAATLIANGFGRFAYTPLIPAQIAADWFSPSQTIYFGAANLAGYLVGALSAGFVGRHVANVPLLLRGMMLLATASFFACAWPLSGAWFLGWRFVAGVAAGYLMVLAAPIILPHVTPARRGLAAGAIFLGVGLGILASGLIIPLLLRLGVTQAWLGIGIASLVLTLLAWRAWPVHGSVDAGDAGRLSFRSPAQTRAIRALYLEYALTAVGQVTHVLFLVDFIARGLGRGVETGSLYWVAFGVGSVVGPIGAGFVADRIGFRPALRLSLLIQAIGVALPLASTGVAALLIASVSIGSFISGSVVLTLGRARELTPGDSRDQAIAWGRCTAAFAIGQAISAYAYSALFANFGDVYLIIFAIGAAGFTLALLIDLVAGADRSNSNPADAGEHP